MSATTQNVVITIVGTIITALIASPAVTGYVTSGALPAWVPFVLQAALMGVGAMGYHTQPVQHLLGR